MQDQRAVRFENADLTGAVFKEVVLVNARTSGLIDGLAVNDVEVGPLIRAELDRRSTRCSRWQQPPWDGFMGARYAVVADPDGNAVGLMGPIDPARRRMPPDPEG